MSRPRIPEDREAVRQRGKKYRQVHRADGDVRIDLWISAEVEAEFQKLMASRQVGRKDLVVALIIEAAQKTSSQP